MARRLLLLPLLAAFAALPLLASGPTPAEADHSWGSYHWSSPTNALALNVGDNVGSAWDGYLNTAIADWNQSEELNLTKVAGKTRPSNCRPTSGRIEVCNAKYGNNGWLGIAQIWISGGHITQAVAKMNDTYFNTRNYNKPEWRRLVMCQELAHDFGLDHQDEDFYNPNLGTCMDYTANPLGPPNNEHPNSHDYVQLGLIYDHTHGTTAGQTVATGPGRSGTADDEGPNNPADFGKPAGPKDGLGRDILFVKDRPGGRKLFTHVFWTLEKR